MHKFVIRYTIKSNTNYSFLISNVKELLLTLAHSKALSVIDNCVIIHTCSLVVIWYDIKLSQMSIVLCTWLNGMSISMGSLMFCHYSVTFSWLWLNCLVVVVVVVGCRFVGVVIVVAVVVVGLGHLLQVWHKKETYQKNEQLESQVNSSSEAHIYSLLVTLHHQRHHYYFFWYNLWIGNFKRERGEL